MGVTNAFHNRINSQKNTGNVSDDFLQHLQKFTKIYILVFKEIAKKMSADGEFRSAKQCKI